MSQNLSSAAVVIGALRVKFKVIWKEKKKNEGYFHRGLLIVWCCPAMSVTKT